jgi:hypothetical protein
MDGLRSAEDRSYRRQGDLPYPPEDVLYLLLLELQLQGIRQHLPPAAAAYAKMSAEWLDPLGRVAAKGGNEPFRPVFFVFAQPQIDDIAGHGVLDEDDLSVYAGDGLAFRRVVFYQDIG